MNNTPDFGANGFGDSIARAKDISAEMNRLLELIHQISPGRCFVYALQLSLLVVLVIFNVHWSVWTSPLHLAGVCIAGILVVAAIGAAIHVLRDGIILSRRVARLRSDLADRLYESDRIAHELIKYEKAQMEKVESRSFKEFFLRLHSTSKIARDELSRGRFFERL